MRVVIRPPFPPLTRSAHRSALGAVLGLGLLVVLVPVLEVMLQLTGPLGPSLPLFFLVPVLLASAVGGRVAGAVVAVAAVAAWDWFFIPPFHRVTVDSPSDALGLLVFLAVALITGQLATTARRRADEALNRATTAEALHDLSTALIAHHSLSDTLTDLTQRLNESFDFEASAVILPGATPNTWRTAAVAGVLPSEARIETNRTISSAAGWVTAHTTMLALPDGRIRLAPLRVGGRSLGVIQVIVRPGVELDADRERLFLTFVNGAAIAIEQARLADEERAAELARDSDRLKSALLSSVSHDLRTPLATIKAAASSLLQRDVEWSEADRRTFAADIDAEADRLSRLVSNLLDLSRIEGGALAPQKEWEDVAELVHRVVVRLEPVAGSHPLIADLPPMLPPVCLDAVQVEQVLTNLIENAAKYSPAGTPITVGARVEQPSGSTPELRFSVRDRGEGIGERDRQRIFDPFYRGETAGRRGTGLGLAIVQGLVEAHGGRVWVEGEPGSGSTFTVALPLESTLPEGPAPGESDAFQEMKR